MAKHKDQPSQKPNADLKPTSEPTMNRRDFVNAVAKAAIPTIAFLGLGSLGKLQAKTNTNRQNLPQGLSKDPKDCVLTCEGGCRGCEGECLGTCKDACFLTCEGSCKYTCEGGCNGTCEGTCKGSCDKGCSGQAW